MTNPLMELISSGEGNYNSYNRGTDKKNNVLPANQVFEFTSMTVAEIQRHQNLPPGHLDRVFAVGKYQLIPIVLAEGVKKLEIDPSEKFTPELQDRLFNEYILPTKRSKIYAYITSKSGANLRGAQKATCLEWASVEDPDTPGHVYAEYERSGNKMHTTAAEVAVALNEMRAEYQAKMDKGLSGEEAWRTTMTMGPGQFQRIAKAQAEPHRIAGNVLREGDRGPAVGELQARLNNLGYTNAQGRLLTVDNDFGRDTRSAIEAFQRNNNLTVDGIAGPNTRAVLQEATRAASIAPAMAPTIVPATTTKPPVLTFPQMAPPSDLDVATIRTLQQHLNTLRLADHRGQIVPVTGIYDDATRNAVTAFQQTQGLPGTGLADPATRVLIEARATIVELQQNANMHAIPMRETSLLEVPVHAPGTPSVIAQSQPSVSTTMAPSHAIASPSHGMGHPASVPPAPSEPVAAPAMNHAVAPNQDAFAVIQAQLREMQRQVEAMHHQREQERTNEREQDHARTAPAEPVPHAVHPLHVVPAVDGITHNMAAMTQRESGWPGTDAVDPRHANHPLNALYNELQTRIPDASEKRLLQFTTACHTHQISAENLGRIDFNQEDGIIRFCPSWPPGPVATLDLKEPAPEPQQCIAHIQHYDQQRVQMVAQIQAQVALTNAQGLQGPVLGGPSR
ncbi:peptidoglycan-binding domain-containing protein [Dyella nitratireducens]|uniref:Peptidoglycan binding-like domain-containing protein n=1 Tax=Dyella nitratireducens TaxID=1849580 RepID=A0ABQ1FS56_9GAMM|nr:peptidoglycan-binding protein [Dyella nitratireducens]GGA26032.1 hypothetical protein GCM10010981_13340 [Dyella nitratireducens]GLQ43602.1 hypothetical protein GCM10007902_34520 [Dyella nitratireducens]